MINTKELSKRLNISIRTIYKYCKEGMPHIKLKGKTSDYRFDYDKVIEWLSKK